MRVPSQNELALLKRVSDGPTLATHFEFDVLDSCTKAGWLDNVPFDECPHSKALRWLILSDAGRKALAAQQEQA